MKISDAPAAAAAWYETGSQTSFVEAVGAANDYRCEECGATALDRPLFVDAHAETVHTHESQWAFYLESASLTCAECGDGRGIEVGLPDNPEALADLSAADSDGEETASDGGDEDVMVFLEDDSWEALPGIGDVPTGANSPADKRPEKDGSDSESEAGQPGTHTTGMKRRALYPTNPEDVPTPEPGRGGPRGEGDGLRQYVSDGERPETDDQGRARSWRAELLRFMGVTDVGIRHTFPGRVLRAVARPATAGVLLAALVGFVAAEFVGVRAGATLVATAQTVLEAVGAIPGWPLLLAGGVAGGYVYHLYDRLKSGWPATPKTTAVDLDRDVYRLTMGAAIGGVGTALGVALFTIGVVPQLAVAVLVAGGAVAIAFQARHAHVAARLETDHEIHSFPWALGVRLGGPAAAVLVAVAPTRWAVAGAAAVPAVVGLTFAARLAALASSSSSPPTDTP